MESWARSCCGISSSKASRAISQRNVRNEKLLGIQLVVLIAVAGCNKSGLPAKTPAVAEDHSAAGAAPDDGAPPSKPTGPLLNAEQAPSFHELTNLTSVS